MKTSDRLLLAFISLGLVALTSVQLTLYVKYKNGDILHGKDLLKIGYKEYRLPLNSPALISVKGFEEVVIIPSDSFYFELGKRFEGMSGYQLLHDTIYIFGNNTENVNRHPDTNELPAPPQQVVKGFANREFKVELLKIPFELNQQKLIVYCPNSSKIRVEDGEIFLQGSIHPEKFNIMMDINDCHLQFGRSYDSNTSSNRFYNAVKIHCSKSGVSLNEGSVIHVLNISLDDWSILSDNHAELDSLGIECTRQSRLELTGKNIRKVRFIKSY